MAAEIVQFLLSDWTTMERPDMGGEAYINSLAPARKWSSLSSRQVAQ